MLAREKWQIKTIAVLERVFSERIRQVSMYGHNEDLADAPGPHNHWLDGTSTALHLLNAREIEKAFRAEYETHERPTWMHLVREELAEAFAELDVDGDPEKFVTEILEVAALCVSWAEKKI